MPIYEYECTNCHQQFDLLQKISDAPVSQCPECSKNTAIRLVSAAGFQLKGSGWYATDFKNKGKESKKKETDTHTEGPVSEKKETQTAVVESSTASSSANKSTKSETD